MGEPRQYPALDRQTGRKISLCEHHMLPFTGTATVAYIAEDCAVGLSKIPRLVACYAQRPQMQERLAQQIENTLKLIDGDLYMVLTGCMVEMIGDDTRAVVKRFENYSHSSHTRIFCTS